VEQQHAQLFVLAAGAIETPRLLLLSANHDHPNGLGNRSGLVGRNFMVHATANTVGSVSKHVGHERIGYATCMSWGLYQHEQLPEIGNAILDFGTGESHTPGEIAASSGLWGNALKEYVRKRYGFEINSAFSVEMLPNPENRVTLSSRFTDNYGDPAPAVEMKLGAFEHRALERGARVTAELFRAMEATDISTRQGVVGNHQCGTVRMGKSESDSVCDEWGKCHDLDNLFVAGSSLFPTSGCSNPTLTLAALSLRSGEFIAKSL
jgi:choline dehydrogenase-like flavoprotein